LFSQEQATEESRTNRTQSNDQTMRKSDEKDL